MWKNLFFFLLVIEMGGVAPKGFGAAQPIYLLPRTCAELLPDDAEFISFFESVAKGMVTTDKRFSTRLFRVLALRKRLSQRGGTEGKNPIDEMIRKTLCFYRTQKEPVAPVPYDSGPFLKYLRQSFGELEKRAEEVIYLSERDAAQRRAFEARLNQNRQLVQSVQDKADRDAERFYQSTISKAKKKVGPRK